jgi:uncharacterized protein YjbI with pentapeptide repeats
MANDDHIAQLKKGVEAWNAWRQKNPDILPDLSESDLTQADLRTANLSGASLSRAQLSGPQPNPVIVALKLLVDDLKNLPERGADLSGANLSGANLQQANLRWAILTDADLTGADLHWGELLQADLSGASLNGAQLVRADLSGAELNGADLSKAELRHADLSKANLRGANLDHADLRSTNLVETDLTNANLAGCRVYGTSTWGVKLEGAKQQNLVVTPDDDPEVTVDSIEVAQFIYLMLNNQKVRDVIDTITSKVVLILGRFTDERKAVLDALREELRKRDYVPILFDFEIPARRNITETVTLLARMARFIIADLTDPSSIPQELQAIIPSVRVPVQPLLLEGSSLYSMFKDFDPQDFHWVLPVYQYKEPQQLLATLAENVIAPAEAKVKALAERRP